jgi:hypothetical protein
MLFLLTGPALLADSPAAPAQLNTTVTVQVFPGSPDKPVDCAPLSPDPTAPALTDEMQKQALSRLKSEYLDYTSLHVRDGEGLSDVVARSKGGLQFQNGSKNELTDSNTVSGIVTAFLPGNCLYVRLANFTPKNDWQGLAADLHHALDQHPTGVILDLRNNRCVTSSDNVMAAQLAGLFDKGPLLFSARGYEPLWNSCCSWVVPPNSDVVDANFSKGLPEAGAKAQLSPLSLPVTVLVNGKTSGVGEALAATLQRSGAIVLGQATAGCAGIYKQIWLSDTLLLNALTAKFYLPDGTPLWGHPVIPDIALTVDDQTEKAALALISANHIDDVIQESPERHRLSEATLAQGQDPEWDTYLDSLEQKPFLLSLPVVHDAVLISALDSLKAIRLSQRTLPAQVQADASPPAPSSIQ